MIQSPLKIVQAGGQFIHSPVKKDIFGWWKTWLFLRSFGLKAFTIFSDALKFPHGQHPQIHHKHSFLPFHGLFRGTSESKDLKSQATLLGFFQCPI